MANSKENSNNNMENQYELPKWKKYTMNVVNGCLIVLGCLLSIVSNTLLYIFVIMFNVE